MPFTTTDAVLIPAFDLCYGNLVNGADYFSKRLGTSPWDLASDADRQKALYQATRAIDRLNYKNDKADADQSLQFPRGDDLVVPKDVEHATYEEALVLLDEVDPQKEQNDLNVTGHAFSQVRTNHERAFVSDNIRAGIMSHIAWAYLVPYLQDPNEINLIRS